MNGSVQHFEMTRAIIKAEPQALRLDLECLMPRPVASFITNNRTFDLSRPCNALRVLSCSNSGICVKNYAFITRDLDIITGRVGSCFLLSSLEQVLFVSTRFQ